MGGSIFVSFKLENGGVHLGLFDFSKMRGLVQTIQYIVVFIYLGNKKPPVSQQEALIYSYE